MRVARPRPFAELLALCFVVAIAAAAICLTGCTAGQLAGVRAGAILAEHGAAAGDAALGEVLAQQERLDEQAATMPAGPEREAIERASAALGTYGQQLRGWVGQGRDIFETLNRELQANPHVDAVAIGEAAVKTASPFLPEPYRTGAMAVLAALGLFRAAQNRGAARKIARSIEAVKNSFENGGFQKVEFGADGTKSILRAIQGSAGQRIVDEAQGKRIALPL